MSPFLYLTRLNPAKLTMPISLVVPADVERLLALASWRDPLTAKKAQHLLLAEHASHVQI